jgi:hypothetical protein
MFPLWIASRQDDASSVVVVPHSPQHVATFTSLDGGVAFMQRCGEKDWGFRLMSRSDFGKLVEDLQRQGLLGVCFDPGERGQGKIVLFAELGQMP